MRTPYSKLLFVMLAGLLASFALAQTSYTPESGSAVYVAEIEELNPQLTESDVLGQATLIIADGQLNITLVA